MWQWFKSLFRSKRDDTLKPEQVVTDDPFLREVAARAWNEQKTVIATVDDDGNLIFKE